MANTQSLKKTPLWNLHTASGAKMTAFAGYDMPVQYAGMGVLKEHLHTRAAASLFDVSHMGQAVLTGANVAAALETLVPGDIKGLAPLRTRYTLLLNDAGGIIDDLMVTKWDEDTLYIVVNAACKDKDFAHIESRIGTGVKLARLDDRALLALQGPKAENVMRAHFPEACALPFMAAVNVQRGFEVYISRSGYTGEDGFEISLPAPVAGDFAKELLRHEDVKLAGLGARDSLRLEAGLCLYGQDIDDTTTPAEANLKWTIPKRRRADENFPGAAKILSQWDSAPRLRVGIKPEGRAPLRAGTELYAAGRKIGTVTSGTFGPSLDAPVAMGYVGAEHAAVGTRIAAMLRGTAQPCTVAALPFIEPKYKKEKA
jgi:aminomethyltransferase